MPVYCFTTKDGETVEQFFHLHQRPDFVELPDGRKALYDLAETLNPSTRRSHHNGYPFESDALGINPDQMSEQVAADNGNGLHGTKYNPVTGACVVESREHHQKLKRANRLHDRNSYTY